MKTLGNKADLILSDFKRRQYAALTSACRLNVANTPPWRQQYV